MSRRGWLRSVAVCVVSAVVIATAEPCRAEKTVGGPRVLIRRPWRAPRPFCVGARHGWRLRRSARPASSEAAVQAAYPPERPEHAPRFAGSAAQERIREALAKPVRVDFHETPLDFAVAFLEDSCAIPVVLDAKALEELEIGRDSDVSLRVSNTPLGSVLRLMLRPLELTYTIYGDAVLITTPEKAAEHFIVGIYPVEDLVLCRDEQGNLWDDYDTLIDTVTSTVLPDSWDQVGGWATISGATLGTARVLVISQTPQAHDEIRDLFRHVRQIGATSNGEQLPQRNRPVPAGTWSDGPPGLY